MKLLGSVALVTGGRGLGRAIALALGEAVRTWPSRPNIATGILCTAALMSWSIRYGERGFRESAERVWALRGERG